MTPVSFMHDLWIRDFRHAFTLDGREIRFLNIVAEHTAMLEYQVMPQQ
jgi:hypothetical protein